MRFGVLGPLAVWAPDGEPVRVPEAKVRALLAGLLIHAGRPVSADRLIEDLWSGRPPANAAAALRVKVSQLRRVLGERELVAYRPPGYVLRADPESVDAVLFETLVARAQHTADPRVRASLLRRALDLWRGGTAYAEFADEPFARAAVARLAEQRLVAVEELAEARLGAGEHGLLAAELGDLVAEHPLRERLRSVHMRALYRSGLQSQALASYADLRRHLADDLGLDPGPELVSLQRAILRRDPALAAPARPRTNLPAPLTSLVGRDEAVAEVGALLRSERLVTLIGPGGVGKTRLALAAASEPSRDTAVWLVELAALRPGAPLVEVAEAVATVLGLRDDAAGDRLAASVLDRLGAALSGKETLLVLDNCEHVVDQVATLAGRLLRAAPGLRILATGQEPLRIEGETLWSVPPLAREAAMALFAARAGVEPDTYVAEICARLDGLPLALELAATRMRTLTPRQLAERLDDRFRLLASGRRGAPARQRTLRAMIDWSWELLAEGERVVLRRLAVHADGCTLEAAEEVCAEPGVDVLDALARLVDRSLVTRVPAPAHEPGGEPRFRLLESVAAYCHERLDEAGEAGEVRLRHLRHYTGRAERAEPHLRGHRQRHALAELDAEGANLRAALETAVRLGAAGEALRLVNAMAWYWVLRGRLGEGQRALEAALAIGEAPGTAQARVWLAGLRLLAGRLQVPDAALFEAVPGRRARARAQWFVGFALVGYGDATVSRTLVETALTTFRELDDKWGTAAALNVLARYAMLSGDLAALRQAGEQALALFRELGDRWGEMRATEGLGTLAEITGDYERAADLRSEGLRMAEDLGLWSSVSDALSRLGRIALLTGDHARAEDYHERARRLAVTQSNRPAEHFADIGLALGARRQGRLDEAERRLRAWLEWVREVAGAPGAALVLAELGFVAEQRGDPAAALGLQLEGLAAARLVGDPRATALALEGLAGALAAGGRPDEAGPLLGKAAALRASVNAPLPPGERGDVERISAGVANALGRAAFEAALSRGAELPLEDLLAGLAPRIRLG
ncbi:BTAD domain-containing putative transcriptional regulator [Nonomuraea jiangxiensis]|uniref:Predicted ATPase n=1 Tax=Nonomuraea jiangxiensis TaxID=633440 RepID=A0A1G9KIQ2_9ACTN|nr:BTAD domain-containing putative transcriptional regulator [Nonomuraea jiangxiensis]SDL49601.1 Predicted ATPase [Nonomuraea jiangxiensis]